MGESYGFLGETVYFHTTFLNGVAMGYRESTPFGRKYNKLVSRIAYKSIQLLAHGNSSVQNADS